MNRIYTVLFSIGHIISTALALHMDVTKCSKGKFFTDTLNELNWGDNMIYKIQS